MNFFYLKRSILFQDCTKEEIQQMLTCFSAETRKYKKGEIIWPSGKPIEAIGLILEGSVRAEHVDAWGETTILYIQETGKTFGENYAYAPGRPLLLDLVANEDCTVVFMDAHRIMHRCPHRCDFHLRVATNLTELIALRNLGLLRRSYILASRTTRGKVLAYLSLQSYEHGSHEFDIALNREQMANYLGVDRSALSSELSRMKQDGIIDFHKNHFVLNIMGEVI